MKKGLWMVAVSIVCAACTAGQYRLSEYEKGKLRGYHANEANRLIEANKKNKKANQKAAEKYRQDQSARLNELNRSAKQKKSIRDTKVPF